MSAANIPAHLAQYEIRGVLGKGAMGTVYDGWDPVIHRRVAIKTVALPDAQDEEAMEGLARFKREAQAAGRLTHPNIVGVFDYGETDALAFIVMEFVEGRSLKEVLGAHERMAAQDAIRLMEDVLAGLAYSHGRGVVHRDIKPANIMITEDNRAKIADFGIARIEASSMTQAGTVMGTPAYMSPEQFMGQVVDLRTDLYSCGVMFYQLLTGERPFEGSMTSIMHKAMTTTPPAPSALAVTAPTRLDNVVARAMARRPEDRFATALEFAQALHLPVDPLHDPSAGDATIVSPRARPAAAPTSSAARGVAPAPPFEPKPAKRPGRTPILAAGAAGVLVVAGLAAWLLLPQSRPAEAPSLAQGSTPGPTPAPVTPIPAAVAPPAPVQATREAASVPLVPTPMPSPAPAPTPLPTPTETAPLAALPATPAPTSPPVPIPEPPQQMAAAGPTPALAPLRPAAAVLSLLASSLPGIGCSLTQASLDGRGVVTVSGLAGAGQPGGAVRQALAAADPGAVSQVQDVDGPYCRALDLVRPLADPLNAAGVGLAQEGGPAALLDNQVIALRATMPGFAGFLHIAYLQHDQTVSPLVPGAGYPSQTYAARTAIALGQPRADFQGWRVGPPFGTDMIVAVASTAPLFARPLPESQPLSTYLSSLQAAIDALRRRGGTVAANALVLETRPGR